MINVIRYQTETSTYLQGYGYCEGIPAKELQVGDVTMWNNGGLEKVLSIEFSKTGKTMKCLVEYEWLGEVKTAERKLKFDRIVVLSERMVN
jgi:hypothetical protein